MLYVTRDLLKRIRRSVKEIRANHPYTTLSDEQIGGMVATIESRVALLTRYQFIHTTFPPTITIVCGSRNPFDISSNPRDIDDAYRHFCREEPRRYYGAGILLIDFLLDTEDPLIDQRIDRFNEYYGTALTLAYEEI